MFSSGEFDEYHVEICWKVSLKAMTLKLVSSSRSWRERLAMTSDLHIPTLLMSSTNTHTKSASFCLLILYFVTLMQWKVQLNENVARVNCWMLRWDSQGSLDFSRLVFAWFLTRLLMLCLFSVQLSSSNHLDFRLRWSQAKRRTTETHFLLILLRIGSTTTCEFILIDSSFVFWDHSCFRSCLLVHVQKWNQTWTTRRCCYRLTHLHVDMH